MKSKICKLITIMSFLTLLVIVLAACAPKPEPTEEVVVVEEVAEPAAEPVAEPVTLRIGVTTIWDAISPATGWESYNLRYLFHDGLIEWSG